MSGTKKTKRCVVFSGLPASGKSTLARQLAPALGMRLLDKDSILEELFDSKGVGDAVWRRALSRESDMILQAAAMASDGAVLVSHWRLPGMRGDSGTPVEWLTKLSTLIVNVHCLCDAETAARRFCQRARHAGHGDCARSECEILESIREVARLGRLSIGQQVDVDTTQLPDLDAVLRAVHEEFNPCALSESV